MKGITLCADCAYYNMRTHKCKRGATGEPDLSKGDDVRFFTDCPLTDAKPVRNGTWKYGYNPDVGFLCYFCSACGKEAYWDTDYGQQRFDFCPNCGADMRGGAENG